MTKPTFIQEAATFFVKAYKEYSTKEEPEKVSEVPIKSTESVVVPLAKSVIKDKRQFMAVVLRPNHIDSDNNFYSEVTVEKACHEFNEHCRQANLQHLFDTQLIHVAESYIAPADFTVEDQQFLKGDWVAVSDIRSDDLWDMCLSGEFTGYSVGCPGTVLVEKTDA